MHALHGTRRQSDNNMRTALLASNLRKLNTALQPRNLRRLVQFLVSENNVAISLRINPIIATALLLGPSSGSEQISSTPLSMKIYDSRFREVKQFKV